MTTQRSHHGGAQEYGLADGLGSTTGVADGSKTVVATYQYDAFGAVRAQTGSSANEFKFTGEQVDGSGLQYLRARYYDQATGRFLAEVLMAMADEEEESCSWDIHPRAAGSAWFDTRSPRGLVFHRLPCDEGLLSEELRGESSRHG